MIEAFLAIAVVWFFSKRIANGTFVVVKNETFNDEYVQKHFIEEELKRAPNLEWASFEGLDLNPLRPVTDDEVHEEFQPENVQQWRVQKRYPAWLME